MNMEYIKAMSDLMSSNICVVPENSYIEDDAAVLMVQTNGRISDCNQSSSNLLSCDAGNITWQHISTFFPQLSEFSLLDGENINPHLRFLSIIGYHFEAVAMNGMHFASKLFFVNIEHIGEHYLRLIIRPIAKECIVS